MVARTECGRFPWSVIMGYENVAATVRTLVVALEPEIHGRDRPLFGTVSTPIP